MEFRETKHQVSRGSRPDAAAHDKIVLIKRCSELRATYQIRLLTYMAKQQGRKLVIELPKESKIHKSLRELKKTAGATLRVERV